MFKNRLSLLVLALAASQFITTFANPEENNASKITLAAKTAGHGLSGIAGLGCLSASLFASWLFSQDAKAESFDAKRAKTEYKQCHPDLRWQYASRVAYYNRKLNIARAKVLGCGILAGGLGYFTADCFINAYKCYKSLKN